MVDMGSQPPWLASASDEPDTTAFSYLALALGSAFPLTLLFNFISTVPSSLSSFVSFSSNLPHLPPLSAVPILPKLPSPSPAVHLHTATAAPTLSPHACHSLQAGGKTRAHVSLAALLPRGHSVTAITAAMTIASTTTWGAGESAIMNPTATLSATCIAAVWDLGPFVSPGGGGIGGG